jgi:Sulfatase
VLLIMGDDIGYGHMGAFGGPANTPTFDRLAGQGLSLTNFHTTAVCAASRACLLTGRNAHSVGMAPCRRPRRGSRATTLDPEERRNRVGDPAAERVRHRLGWQDPPDTGHEVTLAGPFDRWPGGMSEFHRHTSCAC